MAENSDNNLRLDYIEKKSTGDSYRYRLDFKEISLKIPFGVERFDISGDTRKTVQQTRGYQQGNRYFDNMYVDSWYTAPNTLVLGGVVEVTKGKQEPVGQKKIIRKEASSWTKWDKSFIDAIELFYKWNSFPDNVRRGDTMVLYDFIKEQKLRVTMKSRRLPMGVNRPNLISFEMNFIVLGIHMGESGK